jgi:hypothetical protein
MGQFFPTRRARPHPDAMSDTESFTLCLLVALAIGLIAFFIAIWSDSSESGVSQQDPNYVDPKPTGPKIHRVY